MYILLFDRTGLFQYFCLDLFIAALLEVLLTYLLFLLFHSKQQFSLFDFMQLVDSAQIRIELSFQNHDFIQKVSIFGLSNLLDLLSELVLQTLLHHFFAFMVSFQNFNLLTAAFDFGHQLFIGRS